MQADMFEGPIGSQVRHLRDQKNHHEKELRRIKQELYELVRKGTSVPINEGRTLFLCQLPSKRHYIYQMSGPESMTNPRENPHFEFLAVDLDRLEEAVRYMKDRPDEQAI